MCIGFGGAVYFHSKMPVRRTCAAGFYICIYLCTYAFGVGGLVDFIDIEYKYVLTYLMYYGVLSWLSYALARH